MRSSRYNFISRYLQSLSNDELLKFIKKEKSLHSNYGTTLKLEVEGIPIFVKQVPLNKIEAQPQNIQSTANLFNLPLCYQYGVNSAGFSVWRELLAHIKTTEWILANECQNFPLMYDWRILNHFQDKKAFDEEEFKTYVNYWENSAAISDRVKANYEASAVVVMFLEYIPEMLNTWLSKEFKKEDHSIDTAIAMVDANLQSTSRFLKTKEMLHFDAHFRNILTDGEQIYFSDFGLAISSEFNLSKEEFEFFQIHENYDRYYVAMELTNFIISHTFGENCTNEILKIYAAGKTPALLSKKLTEYLSSIIKRYALIALRMNSFFETLVKRTKLESYPKDELDQLWNEAMLNS